ncbi:hypothetical protein VF21_10418 [Pseudogymnoascus sp. 05NY08]|nr:hypothetical protein VF21_10418 [Pseudogymnoascus sp. 05NY08]
MVTTQIEIVSPPAVFLQFDQIPKYSPNGQFKSIGLAALNTALEPGTVLQVELLDGMKFNPVVKENSLTAFSWVGSIPGIFSGEHVFRFLESKTTKDGTTLIHEEKFTGLLGFLMGDGMVAKSFGWSEKARRGFETFNVDLKAWVEGGK